MTNINTPYSKHINDTYNRITVLRVLTMYNVKNTTITTNINRIFHLRYRYGVQFLIDLFIESEVYVTHLKEIDLRTLRKDIVYALNQIPDYRLRYEA